jgi:Fe-S-cluster containining protein
MSQLVQIGRHHFRFECQSGCTNCCRQPGEVYLTEDDVPRIARFLDLETQEFRKRYCVEAEDGLRLANPPDKACLFLLENGCSIHQVKPLQCRTFPFWPEHVRNRRSWKRLSQYCPGIGVGPVLPREDVRGQTQECCDAFPDF